jgi:hypothetical protein
MLARHQNFRACRHGVRWRVEQLPDIIQREGRPLSKDDVLWRVQMVLYMSSFSFPIRK